MRRREDLGQNVKLYYGAELYRDGIDSNNLGVHDRVRSAPYVALDVRALRRFSFSVGLRDEIYGSFNHELSPTVAAGYWIAPALKIRASVSRAFRLPSYTDLYYHDPANVGSPTLRPESAWSYEGGIDWNAGGRWRAAVTVFQRRERDGIDYVRSNPNDIWRATNFQRLQFTGVEAGVAIRPASNHEIEFQYTGLHGAQDAIGYRNRSTSSITRSIPASSPGREHSPEAFSREPASEYSSGISEIRMDYGISTPLRTGVVFALLCN